MNHFPNSKIVRVIFAILLISFLTAPSVMATAPREFMNIWEGAKCGATAAITTGGPVGPCDLCDALIVGSNIIYNLFVIAIIVAVLMIVAGGIVFMTWNRARRVGCYKYTPRFSHREYKSTVEPDFMLVCTP